MIEFVHETSFGTTLLDDPARGTPLGDLERVRAAVVFCSTTQFLDEKLGEENREEWLNAAEDDE